MYISFLKNFEVHCFSFRLRATILTCMATASESKLEACSLPLHCMPMLLPRTKHPNLPKPSGPLPPTPENDTQVW